MPRIKSLAPLENNLTTAPLTGLRFVAAMCVLISHAWVKLTNIPLVQLGQLGMTIFFALSGFVLWVNYKPRFQQRPLPAAFREFAAARFARLAPLYVFIIVIGITIMPRAALPDALPAFALWGLMVQSWVPAYGNQILCLVEPIIGHTWSISVEAFFYAIFPAIVLYVTARSTRSLYIVMTIAICGVFVVRYTAIQFAEPFRNLFAPTLTIADAAQWLSYYSPAGHIFEFFSGCIAAEIFTQYRSCRRYFRDGPVALAVYSFIALSLLLIVYTSLRPESPIWLQASEQALRTASVSALIIYVCTKDSLIRATLLWRPVAVGGEISYSIYLLHPLLLALLPTSLIAGSSVTSILMITFSIFVFAALAYVCAFGTYSLIEMPGRRLSRRLLTKSRFAVALGLALATIVAAFGLINYSQYPHQATRLRDLNRVNTALLAFRAETGYFPASSNANGVAAWRGIGWGSGDNWIPELVPKYLGTAPRDPRATDIPHAQYIWLSNGADFKVISLNPEDCSNVVSATPSMGDPRRNSEFCTAYGFWTEGARDW